MAPVDDGSSATASDISAATSTESESSGGRDLVLKVLAAVGTGVGILGFVAFFGGAILWIRAEQAELPANDAVSVIPNSVLVTTGANFLVPAVLIALLAVSVIFLVHLAFEGWRKLRNYTLLTEVRKLSPKAEQRSLEAEAQAQLAQTARDLATSLNETAEQAKGSAAAAANFDDLIRQAENQLSKAGEEDAKAAKMTTAAAELKANADKLQAKAQFALERSFGQLLTEIIIGLGVIVVLPVMLNGAISHVGLFWHGIILGAIAALAGAISLMTYAVTGFRFVWFGVAAFVTVGIYLGFATYYSTIENAKVEPAAALRGNRPPLAGIFIADTPSNLYLGTFREGQQPPRLLVVPRSQVTDLAIGPLLNPGLARKRATAMAVDECHQMIDKPRTGAVAAAPQPACSTDQQKLLASLSTHAMSR